MSDKPDDVTLFGIKPMDYAEAWKDLPKPPVKLTLEMLVEAMKQHARACAAQQEAFHMYLKELEKKKD